MEANKRACKLSRNWNVVLHYIEYNIYTKHTKYYFMHIRIHPDIFRMDKPDLEYIVLKLRGKMGAHYSFRKNMAFIRILHCQKNLIDILNAHQIIKCIVPIIGKK